MTMGRYHSIETMGTVDGPGIRYVIFLQGCPMRCVFCHNRDAWDPAGGKEITVQEVLEDVKHYYEFLRFSEGGVTVTGGEPTMQPEFVTELFNGVKRMGLNTAMDTSGFVSIDKVKDLLEVTDLVLLSIKHVDELKHREITGVGNTEIIEFMHYLKELNKPIWIRYVVIPGFTDDEGDIRRLAEFLKHFPNIELIDILPYHTMGVYKWESMGLVYPLKDIKTPEKDKVRRVKEIFLSYGFNVNIE